MIKVVLADDQPLVRMGLRALIEREADLQVVGEAGNGGEATALIRRHRPDVALLDIQMPSGTGLDVLREIAGCAELADTKVIMVTTFEVDEYVFEALQLGASGFLLKDSAPAELIKAIRVVTDGQALLSPSVTKTLISRLSRRGNAVPERVIGLEQVTPREKEVLAWVATGQSNDEIADQLMLSPATVRTHVGRAMTKLGARDRAQLVVFAIRAGLVPSTER